MDAREMADAAGIPYEEPHARLHPELRREGDAYLMDFPGAGILWETTRVESSRSEMYGLVRVTSTIPGTPELLHQGRFNFTSTAARSTLVKYLKERCASVDWSEIVEQTCFRVLDALREGQPVVRITDVAPREQTRYRVNPLVLEGLPTIIFGPGGSGKSQLGAMIAVGVQGGASLAGMDFYAGKVLVCDWELDDVTYREMAEPIAAGFNMELPAFHYRQCSAPLAEEAPSIARDIDRLGIDLVIVDSLGYAIGGDKTSQELTMRMFSAIRTWKRSVLCIDHITNDETTGNRPFGSAYTVNSARSLWRVQASQEDGSNELSMGLFQTKANFGKQPPVGFKILFEDGITQITREDVRSLPGLREKLSASTRIKTALLEARQSMTVDDIVEATNMTKIVVRARLGELLKRGDVTRLVLNGQNAARWGLPSKREET